MIDVSFVIVNYKTLELTRDIIGDLLAFYPDVPRILIDNGSRDRSSALCECAPVDVLIMNNTNRGHGPAMHQGMEVAQTDLVFTLDTDTRIKRGGFLEAMQASFDEIENLYAVGWIRHVAKTGVSILPSQDPAGFCPYVHPYAAMWRRSIYFQLPPFEDHGAPATANMHAVQGSQWVLGGFAIEQYVEHMIAGTRRMFGGHWHPAEGEKARAWDEKAHYPI